MGRVLVAGGTGFIGSAVAGRLVGAGHEVAVMTTDPSRSGERIRRMGATPVQGDVLDEGSLRRAVEGVEVVVQALTFPTFPVEKPKRRFTFMEFDGRGTARLARAAAAAGVRKYLYSSGVGAAPDGGQVWYRAKWVGEEAIRETGIPHAILRPTWVYGPEDRALNVFVAFHRFAPVVPVIGDGSQRLQPVFVADVAEAFATAVDPGTPEGTFEVGGPDVLTMDEVLRTMMAVRGRTKPLVHFPVVLPKLAGLFLQHLPRPPLSPRAVDFAVADAVADSGSFLAAFDLPLTALRDGLATYLGPRRRR